MKKYDLVVLGGGLSGVAAAVAAAREGISVLLVERAGCLGGAMSNSFVYPFMKHSTTDENGKNVLLSAGIFKEMVDRHRKMSKDSYGWSPEIFKIMLDDMTVEAGVDLLFHTQVIDVIKDGRIIRGLKASGKCGIFEIEADFFIDASGDGDLLYLAGCDYMLGREQDNLCQPMTTCFRLSGVDIDLFKKDSERLEALYKEKRASGEIKNPRENLLYFFGLGKGIVHFNTTRVAMHNPVDTLELSRAELEARRQVLEMYNFLRENSEAFKDSSLISIAQEIGVRESRKLRGVHILTADELMKLTDFEDSIATACYCIDIHNPEGTGTYMYVFKKGEYYKIPYRSLLPKETDNLLVAGRCLSATHEAHSAVRVMPTCACLGQAAGTAAAIIKKTGTNAHTIDVKELQNVLEAKGAKVR